MKLLLDIDDNRAEPLLRLLVELDYVKGEVVLPAMEELSVEAQEALKALTNEG